MKKTNLTMRETWQIPKYEIALWKGRQHRYCVIIPVINEGKRIQSLLTRIHSMELHKIADVIIIDGGSSDGSLESEFLASKEVAGLLIKKSSGKLSAQLRCAYSFALDEGYLGIITIDGNDKDDPKIIPRFLRELENGVDFVQASRFVPGGIAENTPLSRDLAIRFIHAPLISIFSGFKWTDTTQGLRAYSSKMLLDPRVAPFRNIFVSYELLAYLSYRCPKLGFRCLEVASTRRYPKGEVPTKINFITGNISVLHILFSTCLGKYNP